MRDYQISEEFRKLTAPSSKGTQEKYYKDGYWYKVNNYGEALAEELSTKILSCSNVDNYVEYERCMINGKPGCRSKDFLKRGEAFITFQRLYQSYMGGNLSDKVRTISNTTGSFDDQVVAAGNILKVNYEKLNNILKEYPDSPAKAFLIYRLEKYKGMFSWL